ncbi:MAG: site-specific integrase [Alphaproteobacteria bacterium]|uniref:Site-specific integrase n=1 Tax=Candidatus Nitrobium versatile TaxID=2884831 RepID=A0A953LYY4_9BACT|nr:site-specific integrase [Candidatus Nitrobium versatile]
MLIRDAMELFTQHLKGTVKKSTMKSYGALLERFRLKFSDHEISVISPEDISKFFEECTGGLSRATRHLRYTQVKAFFNYVIESSGLTTKNPCTVGMLMKSFKNVHHQPRKILDKETVDEMIFNARGFGDRLILELQARCGLRVGEVLNLRAADV